MMKGQGEENDEAGLKVIEWEVMIDYLYFLFKLSR